ncbi:hypothetical protein NF867_14210 [Solitalea sp. MAHUQ-68]|uniref:Uncharacterized protein n=1 Tax=Solitalea agri TaxID=2953739 RepID=A0A9X2F7Z0_9SPHI|nr:hypothetical protein [Solitalea agri]MCO4294016.1 hypothetical protein [Solitalea agri]
MKSILASRNFVILVIALLSSLWMSCVSAQKNNKMESGEIKVNVVSRGSYQFLITLSGKTYLIMNLPDEFKEEGMKVVVSYKLLPEKGIVYKPSPTDQPLADYKLEVIELKSIRKQN